MKRQISFLWAAFATMVAISSCVPDVPSGPTPGSALVKIACRDASVRQILQVLRSGRGKDICMTADGSSLEITVAFSAADTSPGKLLEILDELHDLNGVLHTEVVENPHPIRQNF